MKDRKIEILISHFLCTVLPKLSSEGLSKSSNFSQNRKISFSEKSEVIQDFHLKKRVFSISLFFGRTSANLANLFAEVAKNLANESEDAIKLAKISTLRT